MKPVSLVMTGRCHETVFEYLFPGDGLEAAAVLLCNQGSGKRCQRLIVSEILCLPHTRSQRKDRFISWPFEDYLTPEKISDIDRLGQSTITIHSHPNGYGLFSEIDNQNDRELFASVCNWFDDGRLNGSAIMLPDGAIRARTVDINGGFSELESVSVVGNDIRIWKPEKQEGNAAYQKKLLQTFGSNTLSLLRSLKVGVVGCSGTGSIIIELLTRNCVGQLVIVDNDRLEEKNLNRIVNSTMEGVKKRQHKVSALNQAIQKIGMGTNVDTYQALTDSPDVAAALIDCDIIFGCVDSALGRYHLDCLASAYLIPYVDVGVHLEANGAGGITSADAVSHYIHPEGDSLLSRGAYTMEQVTAENWQRNAPEHHQRQQAAGYLAAVGEEQPAVMSINMQAACMAFNDFLARIHSYRFDDNHEFGTQRFRLVHGCYENDTDTGEPHPLFKRYAGTGDKSLLVKNNINHD
ncbi:MAG: ThiF family adenylyltransferase [Gammaproteobacteria bacterium]|nr:ThiF family adenylyltransferase [Gammaproteobacteria bacterium]